MNRYFPVSGLLFWMISFAHLRADDGIEESVSEIFADITISEVEVRVQAASVTVVGGDGTEARVTWTIDYRTGDLDEVAEMREALRMKAEIADEVLEVSLQQRATQGWKRFVDWRGWGNQPRVRVEIAVPKKASVEVQTTGGTIEVFNIAGSCELKTSGGRIELDSIVGDIEAETSGGSLRLESIQGDMEIETSGGSIHVENSVGSVEAKTSGGSVDIETIAEAVSAETTGGSISARIGGSAVKEVKLNTMGGGITLALDSAVGGEIDAKTRAGRVRLDGAWEFSGERESNEMRGTFGQGEAQVRLRTLGGGIRIKQL